jgi:hypothetical protein
MSQRNASAAVLSEIAASKAIPFYLFEGYWPSGVVYLTNSASDIVWNGHTYLAGLGAFLKFDSVEESVDMESTGTQVGLSGVPSEMIALLETQDFINRPLRIYKGFFDSAGQVIPTPILIFDGLMDSVEFSEDPGQGTAEINIPAFSNWVDFEKTNGRYTNDSQQKQLFEGDRGLEFVAGLATQQIVW